MGERQRFDIDLLKKAIPNCVKVVKTDADTAFIGVDYIATLDGGAEIRIDGKARRKGAVVNGCEPPLALELWSVCPENGNGGKPGWTCSRSTSVDMILYTFDPDECEKFYLIPFQHLRMAFQRNYRSWRETWRPRKQNNGAYRSEAMFVPANIVLDAVKDQMTGVIKDN